MFLKILYVSMYKDSSRLHQWHLTAFVVRVLNTLMALRHQSTPLQLGPNCDRQTKAMWSFWAHVQLGSVSAGSSHQHQPCETTYPWNRKAGI